MDSHGISITLDIRIFKQYNAHANDFNSNFHFFEIFEIEKTMRQRRWSDCIPKWCIFFVKTNLPSSARALYHRTCVVSDDELIHLSF